MADTSDPFALTNPHIDDWDTLSEFYYSLNDKVPSIEGDIARLRRHPEDSHLMADLFRALHNIKGDAAICKVAFGVLLAHPVETLLARLRSGELPFSDLLADLILLALDRLEMAAETVFNRHSIEHLHLPALVDGFNALNSLPADQVESAAASLIEGITGFRPTLATAQVKPSQAKTTAKTTADRKSHAPDLEFSPTGPATGGPLPPLQGPQRPPAAPGPGNQQDGRQSGGPGATGSGGLSPRPGHDVSAGKRLAQGRPPERWGP